MDELICARECVQNPMCVCVCPEAGVGEHIVGVEICSCMYACVAVILMAGKKG